MTESPRPDPSDGTTVFVGTPVSPGREPTRHFWRCVGANPFGHCGRGIADFYAGLVGDFRNLRRWNRLRRTTHDHHPVHDPLGNAEALIRMLDGEQ